MCSIRFSVRPGLAIKVEQPGTGPLARPGDTVRLHYTAYVAGQDQPFDSSHRRDRPFEFCIGAGTVIAGWELGVTGMAEGEPVSYTHLTLPTNREV